MAMLNNQRVLLLGQMTHMTYTQKYTLSPEKTDLQTHPMTRNPWCWYIKTYQQLGGFGQGQMLVCIFQHHGSHMGDNIKLVTSLMKNLTIFHYIPHSLSQCP